MSVSAFCVELADREDKFFSRLSALLAESIGAGAVTVTLPSLCLSKLGV